VQDCAITNNTSSGGGGGVRASGATVLNCIIRYNQAGDWGGGGVFADGSSTIRSCLISENSANDNGAGGGGGVNMTTGVLFDNCTIARNRAATRGGAIYYHDGVLTNCVVYFNTVGDTPTNITGGAASLFYCCCPEIEDGVQGNTVADPRFMSVPSGSGNTAAGGDYHLRRSSPGINHGVNESWQVGAVDLDGHPRRDVGGGLVDMGPYESLPSKGTMLITK
jgi:predicted outer membrane repeat protein